MLMAGVLGLVARFGNRALADALPSPRVLPNLATGPWRACYQHLKPDPLVWSLSHPDAVR